jgi:hypothetical protein
MSPFAQSEPDSTPVRILLYVNPSRMTLVSRQVLRSPNDYAPPMVFSEARAHLDVSLQQVLD